MKKSNYIISLCLFVFLFVSCGKKEQPKFYYFNENKKIIEEKLISIIESSGSICYVPTEHRPLRLYFKSDPSEIYLVSFLYYSDEWDNKSSSCTLALRDVVTTGWYLDGFQIIRGNKSIMNQQMINRFEKAVIFPLVRISEAE